MDTTWRKSTYSGGSNGCVEVADGFTGIMPVREIFKTLIAIKYSGSVDLEYEIFPDNPMPGVIESISYMRGVLNGMGLPH